MKRIALALVPIAMCFTSCSIIKDYQPAYISAVEVMNDHKLNNKEIRAMRRAARNGEIACYYHAAAIAGCMIPATTTKNLRRNETSITI